MPKKAPIAPPLLTTVWVWMRLESRERKTNQFHLHNISLHCCVTPQEMVAVSHPHPGSFPSGSVAQQSVSLCITLASDTRSLFLHAVAFTVRGYKLP